MRGRVRRSRNLGKTGRSREMWRKTEPSLVFRRLGDAENEVRLVGLRFLQEALHVVLDRYFTQNS